MEEKQCEDGVESKKRKHVVRGPSNLGQSTETYLTVSWVSHWEHIDLGPSDRVHVC